MDKGKIRRGEGKRIFMIWPNADARILVKDLEAAGHTVPYWVCTPEDIGTRSDIILHDHYEAWEGKPARAVPENMYTPPGKDLIEKFLKTESLVLTMMDKKFEYLGVNERRHIYYSMLGYWDGVLEHYRPDVILFPAVPHTVYNFILFNIAKSRGIRTLMFENPWVTDRALTYEDYEEGSPTLHRAVRRNAGKYITLADLAPDLQDYYNEQLARRVVPRYMTHQKGNATGWHGTYRTFVGGWQSIRAGRLWKRTRQFVRKYVGPNLRKEYMKLQRAPDYSAKFIYQPLGFQPERNSSPQAGFFVDQILLAETLSAALPPGWEIYIKEHPSQWWIRGGVAYSSNRYRGYYEKLRAIKGVRLVPVETNTFDLIEHCQAVCSYGSTACWEGLLRGKPAINFGFPWYKDMPEVLQVADVSSARAALEKVAAGYTIPEDAGFRYLKSYEESTFRSSMEVLLKKVSPLSPEENIKNLSDAILRELQ